MSKVPYTKPALTYAEQLKQLKNRGLVIEDDDKALHLLGVISYYRLSGYWYPMLSEPKKNHVFKEGSTFDTAFKLYCFDRELRKFILGQLEKIEVAVRSKMIYMLSHSHGTYWFQNSDLFVDPLSFATALTKLGSEFGRSDEQFIKSYKKTYTDVLPPSWMILEVSSFGNLSYMYQNLKPGLNKRALANYFGLDDTTFSSWLHSIVYIRNVCAHHSRLWNRDLGISPRIPISPTNPWIKTVTLKHSITGQDFSINKKVYFLLSMIMYLLNTVNPNHTFNTKLLHLLSEYPEADIKSMGFTPNWENEPLWK